MNIHCFSVFRCTTLLFQVKGMGHEMYWNFVDMHAIDIGLKKGPRRVFKISRCSSSRKKIFLYILYCLRLMRTSHRLIMLSACRWSKFYFFSLVRAAGYCFPLVRRIFYFYANVSSASQSAFITPPPSPAIWDRLALTAT